MTISTKAEKLLKESFGKYFLNFGHYVDQSSLKMVRNVIYGRLLKVLECPEKIKGDNLT